MCGARGGGWGGTPGSWVPSRSQGSRQHRSAGPRAPRPLPKTACHATPTPRACSTSSPRCARCPWSATSRCVSAHVHAARMLTSDAFHHACPRPPCPLPPPPPPPVGIHACRPRPPAVLSLPHPTPCPPLKHTHTGLPRQVLLPPHGHHEQASLRRHPDPLPPQAGAGVCVVPPPDAPNSAGPHRPRRRRRAPARLSAPGRAGASGADLWGQGEWRARVATPPPPPLILPPRPIPCPPRLFLHQPAPSRPQTQLAPQPLARPLHTPPRLLPPHLPARRTPRCATRCSLGLGCTTPACPTLIASWWKSFMWREASRWVGCVCLLCVGVVLGGRG